MSSTQLSRHDLWWNGPPWLSLANSQWPSLTPKITNPILKEERPGSSLLARPRDHQPWDLLTRYSSLKRLLTITSLCQKAVDKFKRQPSYSKSTLDHEDYERALLFWIHSTQHVFFADTIHDLSNDLSLSNSNPLLRYTPFLDHKGTLCLGGRLKHFYLDSNAKHPIILPRHCPLSDLLIADAHDRTLHGGTQVTMATLRQRFWILGGRAFVRSHILKCITCARYRSIRAQQLMGQLPTVRVTPSRPFLHTGVDYAGPDVLKTRLGLGAKTYKGWLAIFTCFSTSAVHLEVVSDYSANAFLAAYRRLVGRRGIFQVLYSDCGTTFQGANSTLRQLFSDASLDHDHLKQLLLNDGTLWKFNPPAAPHFRGKWEAAVKLVKFHLNRTIGDTPMTFEELTTLLIQIESVLNSRPLSALSEDPDDLKTLTPGHFLIGQALNTIPKPSLLDISTSRLDRWQFLQQRLQYFWSRWSSECLQRHLSRSKWFHQRNEIQVGSLVLITNEHTPPSKWPLARVIKLHPGNDGLTRVVIIRSATTTLKRPIAKLAILPLTPQDDITDSTQTTPNSDNTVAIAGEKC
ncbi:uncharacterized protein LOC122504847 [Leptopilina heterotoma]|uniref:uncharacterized protein LOC122504847 n=1 Tax=Leptopilina heterotoma TaxID=63436 RepID=UPI001CA882B7|nr:uncharacterized protein LOC122504847 [Leptopilina heterotoma]